MASKIKKIFAGLKCFLILFFCTLGLCVLVTGCDRKHAVHSRGVEISFATGDAGEGYLTIIFLSHLDTVGIEEEKEYLLTPVEKNGFVYGRGAADAKPGLACMLGILRYARDNG
jgi:acetylornithine deacetylase/succinyl-diaminopimelate desuccinylase-like protein